MIQFSKSLKGAVITRKTRFNENKTENTMKFYCLNKRHRLKIAKENVHKANIQRQTSTCFQMSFPGSYTEMLVIIFE